MKEFKFRQLRNHIASWEQGNLTASNINGILTCIGYLRRESLSPKELHTIREIEVDFKRNLPKWYELYAKFVQGSFLMDYAKDLEGLDNLNSETVAIFRQLRDENQMAFELVYEYACDTQYPLKLLNSINKQLYSVDCKVLWSKKIVETIQGFWNDKQKPLGLDDEKYWWWNRYIENTCWLPNFFRDQEISVSIDSSIVNDKMSLHCEICPKCKEQYEFTKDLLNSAKVKEEKPQPLKLATSKTSSLISNKNRGKKLDFNKNKLLNVRASIVIVIIAVLLIFLAFSNTKEIIQNNQLVNNVKQENRLIKKEIGSNKDFVNNIKKETGKELTQLQNNDLEILEELRQLKKELEQIRNQQKLTSSVTIATGPYGGVYLDVGAKVADIIETKCNIPCKVQLTEGSKANIIALLTGNAQFAIIQSDILHQATHYQKFWKAPYDSKFWKKKFENLRVVIPLHKEYLTTVINSKKDLKTARLLWIGRRESGTRQNALDVLKKLNVDPSEHIKFSDVTPLSDLPNLLKTEEIDGIMYSVGHPCRFFEELFKGKQQKFHFLSFHNLGEQFFKEHKYYTKSTIPQKNIKKYLGYEKTVETVQIFAFLVTTKDIPKGIVDRITNSIVMHFDKLKTDIGTNNFKKLPPNVKIHPEAKKYYINNQ